MHPSIEARNLISSGRLREAAYLLDQWLGKNPNNDDLWYLRGAVSLKLNNHDAAQECFERALSIKNKAAYHKIIGMAHLEMFEVGHAVEAFANALKLDNKDAETNFYMAVCLILLGDPRSKEYMEKAYLRDKKKTKDMLKSFCQNFFFSDPAINEKVKNALEKKIDSIK